MFTTIRIVNTFFTSHDYYSVAAVVTERMFKIYSPQILSIRYSIVNYSCDAVHSACRTFSSYRWTLTPFDQHPLIYSNFEAMEIIIPFSVSMRPRSFNSTYKWGRIWLSLSDLFNIMASRSIHVVSNGKISFFLRAE